MELTKTEIENNMEAFITRATEYIHRPGLAEFLLYLETDTDFFYAPCSTRFHLSCEGGLVEHSLNVHDDFDKLCDIYFPNLSKESRALCALFHDVCKINTYNPIKKSRKTGKTLPNGKPEWEDYWGYDFIEEFPYGHGEKSVYILQKFIKLTDAEAMAIRWHMAFSDVYYKGGMSTVSSAIEKYPIIALLHSADLISTSREG